MISQVKPVKPVKPRSGFKATKSVFSGSFPKSSLRLPCFLSANHQPGAEGNDGNGCGFFGKNPGPVAEVPTEILRILQDADRWDIPGQVWRKFGETSFTLLGWRVWLLESWEKKTSEIIAIPLEAPTSLHQTKSPLHHEFPELHMRGGFPATDKYEVQQDEGSILAWNICLNQIALIWINVCCWLILDAQVIVWYFILTSQCICLKSTPVYHTFAKLPCFSQATPAPNALKENLNLVEMTRAWRMSCPTAHVAVVLQDQDEKGLGHCFPKWLSWRKIKLKIRKHG